MYGLKQSLLFNKNESLHTHTDSEELTGFSGFKGQSAIEYLMTYGWMLLVVAIVGGSIFSIAQSESVESVSGFTGADVQVDDFGITSGDELQLVLRNADSNSVTVEEVRVSDDSNTAEWIDEEDIGVGDTGSVTLQEVGEGDGANSLDVEIIYSSGGLENLQVEGSISGNFEVIEDSTFVAATADLSDLDIAGQGSDATVDDGESGDVDVTVENVGDESSSFDVDLSIENGETVSDTESTSDLGSGDSEIVTFADPISGLSADSYSVDVEVSGDESVSGSLEVESGLGEGEQEWTYSEHTDFVNGVAVDESTGTVFSASGDNEVHAIDVGDGSQEWTYSEHNSTLYGVAVDESTGTVFSGSDWDENEVHAIDVSDGSQEWTYSEHTAQVNGVAVDESTGTVFSASDDKEVHAIDVSDGSQEWTYSEHTGFVEGVAVDESTGTVFSGSGWDEYEVHAID
ncbi:MAG: PQQ-binding-like beta-propeller repeat protein [Candidatus Nanohaloarchaea archaeon]